MLNYLIKWKVVMDLRSNMIVNSWMTNFIVVVIVIFEIRLEYHAFLYYSACVSYFSLIFYKFQNQILQCSSYSPTIGYFLNCLNEMLHVQCTKW